MLLDDSFFRFEFLMMFCASIVLSQIFVALSFKIDNEKSNFPGAGYAFETNNCEKFFLLVTESKLSQ